MRFAAVPCLQPHFVPLSLRRGKQVHLAMSRARFVDFLHLRFGQAAHLVQSHGGNEGAAPPRHSRRVPAPVSISVMTCPPSSGPISSFAAGMGRPLQTVVVELRALANLRGAEHGGGIRPGGQSLPRAQEQSAPPQNDGASPRLRRPWPLVSPLRSLPAPKPQQMHDMGSG
jgi:hypothetical protein